MDPPGVRGRGHRASRRAALEQAHPQTGADRVRGDRGRITGLVRAIGRRAPEQRASAVRQPASDHGRADRRLPRHRHPDDRQRDPVRGQDRPQRGAAVRGHRPADDRRLHVALAARGPDTPRTPPGTDPLHVPRARCRPVLRAAALCELPLVPRVAHPRDRCAAVLGPRLGLHARARGRRRRTGGLRARRLVAASPTS